MTAARVAKAPAPAACKMSSDSANLPCGRTNVPSQTYPQIRVPCRRAALFRFEQSFTALTLVGRYALCCVSCVNAATLMLGLRVAHKSGKEMLGRLSTNKGKMWVLHHLGRNHRIHIATLNHSSNGFLAVQVCLLYAAACVHSPADRCQRCQHMDAFPRMSTRGLTPADCLLTCSATHLSWWCGTRDTLAAPAGWTACTANRCLAVPSSWQRGRAKLSPATCSHCSSGSAQLCMRLRGFVTAGVKSSPPVFTAALCVTMVRRKLTRRPALSRTFPATTRRHKMPTSWWCRCMTRPTHHQQRHASGAQAGVARDGFKLCCQ